MDFFQVLYVVISIELLMRLSVYLVQIQQIDRSKNKVRNKGRLKLLTLTSAS